MTYKKKLIHVKILLTHLVYMIKDAFFDSSHQIVTAYIRALLYRKEQQHTSVEKTNWRRFDVQ